VIPPSLKVSTKPGQLQLLAQAVVLAAFRPYLDGEGLCIVHFVDDYDVEVYVPPQVVIWALDFDDGQYPEYAANRSG